jgi:hypothetical protein
MRRHTFARPIGLVLALVTLVGSGGCGGGGGDGDGGDPTFTFAPSSDAGLIIGGGVNGAPGLQVGRSGSQGLVAGVRFSIFPFLDSGDTILSARLRLRQVSVTGAPYPALGNVVVDYVDFGGSLGAGDDAAPVISSVLTPLSSDATLGFKEVDVTAQVAAAAAGNSFVVDFLLRFSALAVTPSNDFASFENQAGSLGTPDGPELIVTYR